MFGEQLLHGIVFEGNSAHVLEQRGANLLLDLDRRIDELLLFLKLLLSRLEVFLLSLNLGLQPLIAVPDNQNRGGQTKLRADVTVAI